MKLVEGTIENTSYEAQVIIKELQKYDFVSFDINTARSSGIIVTKHGSFSYSKWVTPKRTRTYPFARIYDTFNAPKKLTVIPVLKDEGNDGDLDKIGVITFNWMSLLGIFIVLGYYENAEKNVSAAHEGKDKLIKQKFNNVFIKEQVKEIMRSRLEAIHWNKQVINGRLLKTLDLAIESYKQISEATEVAVHSYVELLKYRDKIRHDIEEYNKISLTASSHASLREYLTRHSREFLGDGGVKLPIAIKNYLGGTYFLTIDELLETEAGVILQESKNTTKGTLPSLTDIKDGLFRLILYSNMHTLTIDGKEKNFTTRMKLTSPKIIEQLNLPATDERLDEYFVKNPFLRNTTKRTIRLLNAEVKENRNISIVIGSSR